MKDYVFTLDIGTQPVTGITFRGVETIQNLEKNESTYRFGLCHPS
ncbi:hypothetical protein [Pseudogracilibacillus sp. SO30301A]